MYWVIPGNIRTIPWAASWEGEREVSWTGLLKVLRGGGGGGEGGLNAVWKSKCMGKFSSEFPEGEDGESFA